MPRMAMIKKCLLLLLLSYGGLLYADSVGPFYPATCVNVDTSNTDWITVDEARLEDAVVARSTLATTNIGQCAGYGFTINGNTIIDGIYAEFKRAADAGKLARDKTVQLYKAGVLVGDDKSITGTEWDDGTLVWKGYGSSTDTWNTTWTPSEINDPTFGTAFAGEKDAGGSNPFNWDATRVTVYFHYIPLKTQIRNGELRNAVLK